MFAELPKLFDRDFVVGFFLPAALLGAAGWAVLAAFHLSITAVTLESLTSKATVVVGVWLISVALLALNYPILRFLEGYPWQWLGWPLKSLWKWRFRKTAAPMLVVQRQIDEARKQNEPEPVRPENFRQKLRYAVENYPDDEQWVLPTKFGNVFRSIEVYSRVVYGMDAIPVCPRLQ